MRKIFVHSFVIDVATTRGITRFSWAGDGRKLRQVIAGKISDWQQAWVIVDGRSSQVSTLYR